MKNLPAALRRLFSPSETKRQLTLAAAVGVGTGVATGLFLRLVEIVQFWPAVGGRGRLFSLTLNWPLLLVLPAIGGLLCGAVLQFGDSTVKGTGTPEILHAIRRKGGLIGGRYTALKTLASVFTVCSGGAAGPEAPMVTFGAGLGSWAGRKLGISAVDLHTLVAAGAAAGFAAVFNAPIAGVLFAIEVLLKEFTSGAFAIVMLATVSASVTTHLILGERVFVEVPSTYAFHNIRELGFYFALAVLAALFAKLFVATSLAVEKRFEKGVASPMARAALGGLILGALALWLPQALGNGRVVIPDLIRAESSSPWAWALLIALLFGKMVACPLTVGSGGSGGIFIPYLLMGAALGGLVGRGVSALVPWAAPSGAYMLVGMGAVFAGVTFAPFTAIILLFELTRDYSIVLPLMFTAGITVMVARAIDPLSFEGHKLLKKGVRLNEHPELRVLEKYHVRDIMSRSVRAVPQDYSLRQLANFIVAGPHTGYPVVDPEGRPVGLLTPIEMQDAFGDQSAPLRELTARDIMRPRFPTISPDEPIEHAIRRMHEFGTDHVLVIDPAAPAKIAGIVTQSDVLGIYRRFFE